MLPPAGGWRGAGGGEGRGDDSDPRQEAERLSGCTSEGLLAARPGLGCGRRGTGSVHRSGHRPGRGHFACAAGCCLQHGGEYGAPRLAGVPRGRVRCGGCPAVLGAPSPAAPRLAGARARSARCPGECALLLPARFCRPPRGLPPRSDASGAAVPPSGGERELCWAPHLTCGGEQPGGAGRGAPLRGEESGAPAGARQRGERVPAAPLPAPRPGCSLPCATAGSGGKTLVP